MWTHFLILNHDVWWSFFQTHCSVVHVQTVHCFLEFSCLLALFFCSGYFLRISLTSTSWGRFKWQTETHTLHTLVIMYYSQRITVLSWIFRLVLTFTKHIKYAKFKLVILIFIEWNTDGITQWFGIEMDLIDEISGGD